MDNGVVVKKISSGWSKQSLLAGSHLSSNVFIVSDKLYKLSKSNESIEINIFNEENWSNSQACYLYQNSLFILKDGVIKKVDVTNGQVSDFYTNKEELTNIKALFVSHYDHRFFLIKENGLYILKDSKVEKLLDDLRLNDFKSLVVNQSNVYFSTNNGDLIGLYEGNGHKKLYTITNADKEFNAFAQAFIGGFYCLGKEKISICYISDMCVMDRNVTFSEDNGNLGQVVNFGAVNCSTPKTLYVLYDTGNIIEYTFI